MSLNKPEPAPIANDKPAIWELVIADMRDRDHIGREKYGTPLQTGNGRNPLIDAHQEALDLCVYLRQAIEERAAAGWQPIETAPTNTSILIYVPDWDHYGPGIFRAILVDMGTGRRWHTTAWACGRNLPPDDLQPTHWMKLPEIPKGDGTTPPRNP